MIGGAPTARFTRPMQILQSHIPNAISNFPNCAKVDCMLGRGGDACLYVTNRICPPHLTC